MFLLFAACIPLALVPVFLALHSNAKRYNRGDGPGLDYQGSHMVVSCLLVLLAIVILAVSVIQTLVSYSNQISDGEMLVQYENLEEIYTKRSETLTQKFATYLADLYPEYEKEVFEHISPDGIDVYLVRYPELKASATILELIGQIRSMEDDRYEQQIAREKTLKSMRYRKKSPWIYNSFIPNI